MNRSWIKPLIFSLFIIGVVVTQTITSPLVHAAGVNKTSATIDQQVQADLYARSIASCFENTSDKVGAGISLESAKAGSWFSDAPRAPVPDLVGEGYSKCGNTEDTTWVVNAASFFGYASPEKMLESFGWTFDQNSNTYRAPLSDIPAKAFSALEKQWGGSFEWTNAQDYWALQAIFQSACDPQEDTSQSQASSTVKLPDPNNPAKTISKNYTVNNKSKTVYIRSGYKNKDAGKDGRITGTCQSIMKGINDKATDYEDYLLKHKNAIPSKDAAQSTAKKSGSSSTDKTTCSPDIGGASWIICPVMTFMGDINDNMYSIVSKLLEVKSSSLSSSGSGANAGAYEAWKIFRDYANVAFVIIMIVIILSQISSIGISNYGIKKMLPRLIAAAVLVNVSFLFCQLAVDISNLLGYAVKSLFDGITNGLASKVGTTVGGAQSGMWAGIVGGVLAGGTALVAIGTEGIFGLLALLAPVLLAALLALATILLILVARQAIIILLVVIAPLAFVAYVLPNTQSLMKKWWHIFYTMLLLFPIVSAVFGASNLAGAIIGSASGTLWTIVALGVTAIPLFIVPGLLKGALNATGALGAKIQGIANKTTGAAARSAKGAVKNSAIASDTRAAFGYRKKQREVRGTIRRSNSRALRGLYGAIGGQAYRDRNVMQNQGAVLEEEEYEKDVKMAQTYQANNMDYGERLAAATTGVHNGRKLSTAERDAAIRDTMEKGNDQERRDIMTGVVGTTGQDDDGKRLRSIAINSERKRGGSALYGAKNLAALEAGGQQVPTGEKNADGSDVTRFEEFKGTEDSDKFLTSSIATRVANKAIKPSVALNNDKTAAMVQDAIRSAETKSSGSTDDFKKSVEDYLTTNQGKDTPEDVVLKIGLDRKETPQKWTVTPVDQKVHFGPSQPERPAPVDSQVQFGPERPPSP